VRHLVNDAGKPTQNAYIESFNGKFRDECLSVQWIESLHQGRRKIARWRRDYIGVHAAAGRAGAVALGGSSGFSERCRASGRFASII